MKLLICLMLALLARQPILQPIHRHWCEQPIHKLQWLGRIIEQIRSYPHKGQHWAVYQAHYWGQEVFVLHVCRPDGQPVGFLLYDHSGTIIGKGGQADSIPLRDMIGKNLLAEGVNKFSIP